MGIESVMLIGLALAMDASAIALSIGINPSVSKRGKMMFVLSFAFFQFLLSFIGAYGGIIFETYIANIPNIIGGMIIAFVGVMMIKEGMEHKEESVLDKPKMYIILGISVSIDALVIGFTALSYTNDINILVWNSLVIGIITLILSSSAFLFSK
ncbi:MAG: manganese efflux pump MntP family protein, partial [Sarcina sp.]